ncbi:MAG: hypothetical protein ACOCV2_09780, partial [Persicimonas sp.]
MSDEPLVFERLEVKRAAIFEPPGFALDDLSGGVNLVRGPNASGKTTVARVLQTLLWPLSDLLDAPTLVGHFRVGDDDWRVSIDASRRRYQRGGVDEPGGPKLPPATVRDRYHLSLDELIDSENRSFAEQIARESAGGFDVGRAREALGFTLKKPHRRKLTDAAEEAKEAWQAAREEHDRLREEEKELRDLRRRRDEAREAARRAEAVERAIKWRRAHEERTEAKRALEAFPDGVDRLRGDELERLEKREEQRAEAEEEIERAEAAIADERANQRENPVPARDDLEERARTLENYAASLAELERRRRSLEEERAAAKSRCESERQRLGQAAPDDEPPKIDVEALDAIEDAVRRVDDVGGKVRAHETLEAILGEAEVPDRLEEMRAGMRQLRRWLASPDDSGEEDAPRDAHRGRRLAGVVLSIFVAASGAGLAWAVDPLWVLLIAAAAIIAWLVWTVGNASKEADDASRDFHRREFERLGLHPPEAWRDEEVERRFEELADRWADAMLEAEKARAWTREHADQLEACRARLAAAEEAREALAADLGVSLDVDTGTMFWVVGRLAKWHDARSALVDVDAKLEQVDVERRELLEKTGRALEELGFDAPEDIEQAEARVASVAKHVERLEESRRALKRAEEKRESAAKRRDELAGEIEQIYERVGLEVGDRRALEDLCGQKAAYDEARERHQRADVTAENARAELDAHPAYDEAFEEMSVTQLEDEAAELETQAGAADELHDQIKEIEVRIEEAKKSHEIEQKRAAYDEALEALRRERTIAYRKRAGAILSDFVRDQTRDRERPEVFHRARELFARITSGAYRLDLSDGEDPTFSAFDTSHRVGLSLDQLSSGTRVQLLLAVRIAFVERHEEGVKLPLILDETLATTDDVRARSVIEAIAEIAAEGRQVFYFTAQHDEVRKWEALLDDRRVDLQTVDLGD